ncbi:hypothetical protein ACQKNS_25995, partial [Peribacillus sp. NPDC094092]|uniref:hypothetical protein n=1 Tax=Peribacillus sp. NPDC094092 TaxID=3390611 RepID=UPI003D05D296
CLTCSFAFLIVCAHLKFNVGALFCSVFKEQYLSKQLIYNNIFITVSQQLFKTFLKFVIRLQLVRNDRYKYNTITLTAQYLF